MEISPKIQLQIIKLAESIKEFIPFELWDETLLDIIKQLICQVEKDRYGQLLGSVLLAELKHHIKQLEVDKRYNITVNECCIQ